MRSSTIGERACCRHSTRAGGPRLVVSCDVRWRTVVLFPLCGRPKGAWTRPNDRPEGVGKMARAPIANLRRNLGDGRIRLDQERAGALDPQVREICVRREAR